MTQLQFHTDLGSGFEFLRVDIDILRGEKPHKQVKFANHQRGSYEAFTQLLFHFSPVGPPEIPLLNYGELKPLNCFSEGENTLSCKNKGLVQSRVCQPVPGLWRRTQQQPEMLLGSGSDAERETFLCKISKGKATVCFAHTFCWRFPLNLSFGYGLFASFFSSLKKAKPTPLLFLH